MSEKDFVKAALDEDIGRGDLFAKIAKPKKFKARIVTNQSGILAGERYAKELGKLCKLDISWKKSDGDVLQPKDLICEIEGSSVAILAAERTLLNMLQHASGIASKANSFVSVAQNFNVKILDTRKTRPQLRVFEKYAAQIGGITNHRMGLDDCLMIKDTHRQAIGDLAQFMQKARKNIPFTSKIEIECQTIQEALQAMALGADIVMCDNMQVEEIRQVVTVRNREHANVTVECSGGINIDNLALYAATGVDAVSIGAAIHQAVWLDFSMKAD